MIKIGNNNIEDCGINIRMGGHDVGACPECQSTDTEISGMHIEGGNVKDGEITCHECGFKGIWKNE